MSISCEPLSNCCLRPFAVAVVVLPLQPPPCRTRRVPWWTSTSPGSGMLDWCSLPAKWSMSCFGEWLTIPCLFLQLGHQQDHHGQGPRLCPDQHRTCRWEWALRWPLHHLCSLWIRPCSGSYLYLPDSACRNSFEMWCYLVIRLVAYRFCCGSWFKLKSSLCI
jgi:hypothetical protein